MGKLIASILSTGFVMSVLIMLFQVLHFFAHLIYM